MSCSTRSTLSIWFWFWYIERHGHWPCESGSRPRWRSPGAGHQPTRLDRRPTVRVRVTNSRMLPSTERPLRPDPWATGQSPRNATPAHATDPVPPSIPPFCSALRGALRGPVAFGRGCFAFGRRCFAFGRGWFAFGRGCFAFRRPRAPRAERAQAPAFTSPPSVAAIRLRAPTEGPAVRGLHDEARAVVGTTPGAARVRARVRPAMTIHCHAIAPVRRSGSSATRAEVHATAWTELRRVRTVKVRSGN